LGQLFFWEPRVWNCRKCAENIEDAFDVCWNCGTSRDGCLDADFKREVEATDASGPDLAILVRGLLNTAWCFVAAAPREGVPGWLSRCCTTVLLGACSLYVAVLADYNLRVEPAVQQGIRDFEARYPHSNSPGVIFLLPEIDYLFYAMAIVLFMVIFTLATWRFHGIWTKVIGFSPFLVAGLVRLIGYIAR